MQNLYLAQANTCFEKFYDPNFRNVSRKKLAEFIQSNLSNDPKNAGYDAFSTRLKRSLMNGLKLWKEQEYHEELMMKILQLCCQHKDFFNIWMTFFNPTYQPV